MYGIVNKSIHNLIESEFGSEKWEEIRVNAEVETTDFLSNEQYDDAITYRLVSEASSLLKVSAKEVLILFGNFWILNTGLEKYGSLMWSGGKDFEEFMMNLPSFHTRIMLMYPNLIPPEFLVTKNEDRMFVEYHSDRKGLTYFVYGMLEGLSKMFKISINIEVAEKNDNQDHDLFIIRWN